jgi:hypothetical protein
MAGYDIEVQEEDIKRINALGVHVVNDLDWLEMYESHGGHDQDDYFKLFYRTMVGGKYDQEKVVIVCRSPNGYGEYTVFRYVEGQWSPTWHDSSGNSIKFLEVDGKNWPERLSDAIFAGNVVYDRLPSEHANKEKKTGHYTPDDVIADMKVAMCGGNVGGYVNAVMAHSLVLHTHRPYQLCSLEKAIDKCINPDFTEDVIAIDQEARDIVREIIESQKPIDLNFWNRRGFKRYLKDGETVDLYEGSVTKMNTLCANKFKEYSDRVRFWAQGNARPPEIVHDLGKRLYFHALPIVKSFRSKIYVVNTSETTQVTGSIIRSSWEDLYAGIVDVINSFERLEDRHDFVMSLYSVSLKVPTSNGKITDQIVMNRFVYPYLEEALQFYGVATTVTFVPNDQDGVEIINLRNETWQYPNEQSQMVSYSDPMKFQDAHRRDTKVVFVLSAPKVSVQSIGVSRY